MSENSETLSDKTVQGRRAELVETVKRDGTVVAFAFRVAPGKDWDVHVLDPNSGYWQQVATVRAILPEVLQRKVILSLLKEF